MLIALLETGVSLALAGGTGWLLKLPRRPTGALAFDAFVVSLHTGWALSIIILYSLVEPLRAAAFWIPFVTGAAGWTLAAIALARGRFVIKWRMPRSHALTLLSFGGVLFFTIARHSFPFSHDAVVHSFVAEKIRERAGLCTNWEPWGPIPVNYPQGLHLFIAMFARTTGIAVPQTFQALLFWFGFANLLAFYSVARCIQSSSSAALAAVAVFLFACNSGAFFDYVAWGGMPTLLSQSFFLCTLVLLTSRKGARRDVAIAGALLSALTMTSQLGAVITVWILAAYVIVSLVQRTNTERALFVVKSMAWQLAFSISLLWIYLPRISSIGRTDAMRFTLDVPISPRLAVLLVGAPVIPLVVLGLFAWRRTPKLLREPQLVAIWALSLAGGTLFFDRAYRFGALLATGQSFTAFVPSRFLTVMACPVALVATAWLSTELTSRTRTIAACALVVAACAAGGILHAAPVITTEEITPGQVALYEWMRASTPDNAFIIYDVNLEPTWWRYYIVHRDMCNVPIPSGEFCDDARLVEKNAACETRDLPRLRAWLASQEKRAFILASAETANARKPDAFRFVGEHGGFALLELVYTPAAIADQAGEAAGEQERAAVRADDTSPGDSSR